MAEIPEYDALSLAALAFNLKLKETDAVLGTATGFIYVHEKQTYIITNWHVVTGRDPGTKELIASHAGIPDILELAVVKRIGENEIQYYNSIVELYDPQGVPYWKIHPTKGEQIDVVAIPIQFDPDVELSPITDSEKLFLDEFKFAIADEVLVLGFPFGLRQLNFPLWKRGTIATEPQFDYEGLPLILIDTATRPGMSGAPVFVRRMCKKNGDLMLAKQFIGVYSGRYIGETEIQAQLGRVWKKSVITEIIEGDLRDAVR